MMMLTTATSLAWAAFFVALIASSTKSVLAIPQVQCPTVPPSSSSRQSQQQPQIFGVSKRLPAMLSVRGGAVLEPETADDVQAIILKAASEQKLVVIDFTATWCGPCKMIAPLFKELSEAMADVVFIKVDVDDHPDTAAMYSVSAMPTFVFLKAGEVVDRLMGANAARLQELIAEHK